VKITFDGVTNSAYIYLTQGVFDHTEDCGHGVLADIDTEGRVIGLEVLDVEGP
jgi:uncharacterized protein YuzE